MMNTAGDVSEQLVKMSLEGVEVAAKITGAGAKQVAAILYSVLKEQKKTTGKMRLTGLLKSGKELKVFAIKKEDLKRFSREAKRYGVLYCVLRDKDKTDEFCDLMVRAEDASKINRIFERFKFASVDTASIKSQIEKHALQETKEKSPEMDIPEASKEEKILDELLGKETIKSKAKTKQTANPTMALTREKSPQSEPILNSDEKTGRDIGHPRDKKSVKKELEEIKNERKNKKPAQKQKPNIHKAPKRRTPRIKKGKDMGRN